MHSPEAIFDVLEIISELEHTLGGVSRLEIQRTAYLACLIALYDGKPIGDWGYRFARTDFGTPFSGEINDATETLLANGYFTGDGNFRLGESGVSMQSMLKVMENFQQRLKYLEVACASTLIVPPAMLYDSLDNEPTMRRALGREGGGGLLDGPAMPLLYEQFSTLSEAVDRQEDDLLTPSVVWLSYVAEEAPASDNGASFET